MRSDDIPSLDSVKSPPPGRSALTLGPPKENSGRKGRLSNGHRFPRSLENTGGKPNPRLPFTWTQERGMYQTPSIHLGVALRLTPDHLQGPELPYPHPQSRAYTSCIGGDPLGKLFFGCRSLHSPETWNCTPPLLSCSGSPYVTFVSQGVPLKIDRPLLHTSPRSAFMIVFAVRNITLRRSCCAGTLPPIRGRCSFLPS